MSRYSARRISRPLIAALGVTIVIGAAVYVHKHHKPKTVAAAVPTVTQSSKASTAAPIEVKATNPKPADAKPAPVKQTPAVVEKSPTNSGGLLDSTPNTGLVTQTPTAAMNTATGSRSVANAGSTTSTSPTTQPDSHDPSNDTAVASVNDAPLIPDNSKGGNAFPVSADDLSRGRKEKDAGHLLTARELINNSLMSGQLSDSDAQAAREMLSELSQDMLFTRKQVPGDPYTDLYQIQNGDRLSRIADHHSIPWPLLLRINGMSDARRIQAGRSLKVINGPFHAVVNKSKFRLDLYLGNPGGPGSMFVRSFAVGLGRDNSTPTGLWVVQQGNKAHPATYYSPRGEGVIAANDPKNPLGGYWMGITGLEGNAVGKSSYGIHGTIDPDSIGKQSSMGCIRLGHEDIAFLYDILVEGKSKVMIKD